ncbi:MAG: DNA polymerase III subunit delta' [Helicobacter sp.]|nr:DNA polymerase III subunit delta' [Helicobacter sp.]
MMESLGSSLKIGHIILVDDPLLSATQMYESNNPQFFKLFKIDKLNIETSRAIIDESYIASDGVKTILIAANSYNIEAQNALLKVLEEPPKDVIFIIFSKAKSLLLPTICSRMPIFKQAKKERIPPFPIAIRDLNLNAICAYVKELEKDYKSGGAKVAIQSLYLDSLSYGIKFTNEESDKFFNALLWDKQGQISHYTLLPLLLLVLRRKKEKVLKQIS